MWDVSSIVSSLALIVSVASAFLAALAWWTNREKLRLDLYNRRFDIYSRTLDFYHALLSWEPTQLEKDTTNLQDSEELRTTQRAFIKASREAQFLFDEASGIPQQLEQIHADTIGIIGYKRDFRPKVQGLSELDAAHDKRLERLNASIPSLEQKMSKSLDFHRL